LFSRGVVVVIVVFATQVGRDRRGIAAGVLHGVRGITFAKQP
jgi:hypothetical protein